MWHVQMGCCDHCARAYLLGVCVAFDGMGVSVAFDGIRTGHLGSRTVCLPYHYISVPCSTMSRYTREYGHASWKNKGWAPAAEQHTKNSYSGWSKRGTRGYQCDYENRSRQWEDYKASGLTKDIEGVPEAVVVAEVEAEDNRDKHLGRATADSVTHTAPAHSASSAAAATEKEAIRTRLGKLHRLLNNRKGSVNATYKKNAEANDRAFVMNQRTIQPLGAVAEEYTSFEASMKKVMSEHEEGEVLYAAVTERTDELERAQKDRDHLQDEVDRSCEELAHASRDFSDCWTKKETGSAKQCGALMEVSTKRATHETICVEARKAWQRTYDLKKGKPL